jgi:pimeloyl-ACP methyl ester carboxylesterase
MVRVMSPLHTAPSQSARSDVPAKDRFRGPVPAQLTNAIRAAAAGAFLRPWLDPIALGAIARWYLPLSRAWAAATVCEGSTERFAAMIGRPEDALTGMVGAIAAVERGEAGYRDAAARWEAAFFGPGTPPTRALAEIERQRQAAGQAFMNTRAGFLPLHLRQRIPAIAWTVASIADVEARHGHRLAHPETAFAAPDQPMVERSATISERGRALSWIRFPSPGIGTRDTCWARVIEPVGVAKPPTLIFLHGIGVESEFICRSDTRLDKLMREGVRVIRPEGPWHGRRRGVGTYGSEPIFAQGPQGLMELFEAWGREVAILVRWARSHGSGPVIVGGLSLGALTGQMVASTCGTWPQDARPDGMFLVATSGGVAEAALDGSLGQALGLRDRLETEGWTRAEIGRWRPLMEPHGAPAIDPANIVLVLGTDDDVTPFAGGVALAERWNVPAGNRAISRRGHFSTAMAFAGYDPALDILKRVMGLPPGRS